ncbi:hypothetical protein [Sediminibacterium sp.]|uniref:hypothetical protein n=1 Tax=Sediminibacterium sp. TaxID=1917865 RepID=UPI0025F35240|nr:hypothetical protein [Sediminibacterium sp.]MBW0178739.1 Abi family protein [Sediminibacterium sp.]
MHISELEILFSSKRLQTYYQLLHGDKEKAFAYYLLNIEISKSFYPLLSTVEIVLRNAIHNSCTAHFGTDSWLLESGIISINDRVEKASKKIISRQQTPTPDLLVAELTFGFWTSLFHKRYAKYFWKPLMHTFPYIPAELKHRDKISYQLENVRKFRNRIFHYEPICNDLSALEKNHKAILDILSWLNKDLTNWLPQTNRFQVLHQSAFELLQSR